MLECVECDWTGEPKDALTRNEIDYCPMCGELVQWQCDEPDLVIDCEEPVPMAETK